MPTLEIRNALLKGSAFINRCIVKDETDYHSHEFVEIAYVASGIGFHDINGTRFDVKKGDVTLINYDTSHKFAATEHELVIYNCIFAPSYFDAVFSDSRNFFDVSNHFLLGNFYEQDFESYIHVTADNNENAHILNIFERLLKEYENKQIGYKEIMRGYMIELLIIIFRLASRTKVNKSQELLDSLEYINSHFTFDIKLNDLATMVNTSTTHYCRLFKSLTGTTVTRYIQSLRIEEACHLLNSTDKNVVEIANSVGYSDIKHFYSVFKKITSKLPKDFR